MNGNERGFLLLTSQLGDPERKVLTVPQFRTLANRMSSMEKPMESRELTREDLIALGYDAQGADRIVELLAETFRLDWYLNRGYRAGCFPITRANDQYPLAVRKRLGLDAPGCLWAKGDLSLLNTQMVSVVGSRELKESNYAFAEAVGREVARQGFTLVSGNARGADKTAQEACLRNGGKVISVVADELEKAPYDKNVLYLSEDSFDLPFSIQRAISRNRVIHALGYLTLVAQSGLKTGGTWDGTAKNLRYNWSPVFCYADESPAVMELEQLGATLISIEQLADLSALQSNIQSLI